jgi:serine protease
MTHPTSGRTARLRRWLTLAAFLLAALGVTNHVSARQAAPAAAGPADPTRLAALLEAAERGLAHVPGELLVRFSAEADLGQRARALSVLRSEVAPARSQWIGDVLHLTGLTHDDPEAAAWALERQPEVAYAQPNYLRQLQQVQPNDIGYPMQWNLPAISMPRAWEINPGGRGDVLVAVVDSGLTTATATYQFRVWTVFGFQNRVIPFMRAADFDHTRVRIGRDFIVQWVQPSGQNLLFDASGHGTHVAGTIAQQTHNGIGFAGVAYSVTLLPLKVCLDYWTMQLWSGSAAQPGFHPAGIGACPEDAQVRAIRHAADEGAQVINLSIGGTGAAPAIREALTYAVQRGAFVSIAAGNFGDQGNPTVYPAAYAPQIDGVVAVSAVNRSLTRARYSSYGSYVELVAPGGESADIYQMTPNPSDLNPFLLSPRFDRYAERGLQGTSMAAPHVAGVAALLYSQGITNPAAIEAALKRFARDLGPPGRDDEYGYGLVDARAALRGLGVAR